MMRSFVVALVTILLVTVVAPFERLAAQPNAPPQQAPVDFVGGVPGVNIEIYINAGKVADAPVGSAGDASWVLDLSNMGKTRVQIYVDVCKDGKIVKVAFVTGNGQPPPKDEDCDRKLLAVGFQSDCGVTRITIDIRSFGARVIGCGSFFTKPQGYGSIIGGGVLVALLAGGGGDSTSGSSFTSTPTNTQTSTNTPTATPPPPSTPPSTTTPNSSTPIEYNVTLSPVTFHPPGANTSFVCGLIITTPGQSGASWIVTLSGPGVLTAQTTGTLNANGRAAFQNSIGSFGNYTVNVSVTSSGVTRTASAAHNVGSGSSACPTP